MKNIPHFFLSFTVFFLFSHSTQKRIVKPFSLGDFSMSILPITAPIKHNIAAENHELAIQV